MKERTPVPEFPNHLEFFPSNTNFFSCATETLFNWDPKDFPTLFQLFKLFFACFYFFHPASPRWDCIPLLSQPRWGISSVFSMGLLPLLPPWDDCVPLCPSWGAPNPFQHAAPPSFTQAGSNSAHSLGLPTPLCKPGWGASSPFVRESPPPPRWDCIPSVETRSVHPPPPRAASCDGDV